MTEIDVAVKVDIIVKVYDFAEIDGAAESNVTVDVADIEED